MMLPYYDRDGHPIDRDEFARLLDDPAYRRVARTTIVDGADPSRALDVSTVWLGIDHNMTGDDRPVIFETMVFGDGADDLDCERYATEADARRGHADAVTVVAATITEPIIMHADDTGAADASGADTAPGGAADDETADSEPCNGRERVDGGGEYK